MKFGEVVVHIEHYSFTKFHCILMKNIIVLYQTHLMDSPSVGAGELGLNRHMLKSVPTSITQQPILLFIMHVPISNANG